MEQINLKSKKKMRNSIFFVFFLLILLIARIGYIQLFKGEYLQNLAIEQQLQKRKISAKRGIMLDSSEKYVLAISSTAYTVTINPSIILAEKKYILTNKLCEIFDLYAYLSRSLRPCRSV